MVPLLDEFWIGLRKVVDELIEEVDDVIDHVVANDRLFCCDKLLDYKSKTHFFNE